MAELRSLILETRVMRKEHHDAGWHPDPRLRQRGRLVDAAACAIRERALLDAWKAVFNGDYDG